VLKVHVAGKHSKPISVGYISTTGKVQLDLTKMKSYMLDNRTEISLQKAHAECQGTYDSDSQIPRLIEVN
jgi:hypothetical protein